MIKTHGMRRRDFFALTAAAAGNEPLIYRDYSRVLPEYLGALAARAYASRNQAIAKLTTAAAIAERQRWVMETFWTLVGGKPEQTPLNARTTGTFERRGYRVENVVYETQPGFQVSANLYVPASGRAPYPAVLFQMGHSSNGKAADPYQKCCQGLARLGFVVLGFDPMGQGERIYYPGASGASRLPGGADDEHTVPGKQMLLVGDSATRLQTWDAVRSLDYLASLPIVDSRRLASTGQSGGGTNTMLLAAVDDRLAAAAVACGNTENVACRDFKAPGSTDDAEQNFPGSGPLGFDRWDLLYPLAPKPLLILPSAKDSAGTYSPNYIASGVEEFAKLRRVYEVLGKAERLAWQDSPLPHGLTYGLRLAIYNWFLRWLKEEKEIEEEPEVRLEAEATLFAANGSTIKTLGSRTPLGMVRSRKIKRTGTSLRALLSVEDPVNPAPRRLARTPFRGGTFETIEIESAPNVFLPGWIYRGKEGTGRAVLLLLDPAGRVQVQEGGLYESLAAQGYVVCALDVRGTGDMAPEFSRGAARHAASHRSEQHYAWSSLILGKPLLGQRVTDILGAARALAEDPAAKRGGLMLAARGILTPAAQFAAALDEGIRALCVSGGLISYSSILEVEEYLGGSHHPAPASSQSDLFGAFVPGLLNHTDLPEVVAGIAPRRVTIAGAKNAAGNMVDAATVRQVYGGGHVVVIPEAAWDVEALSAAAGRGA